MHWFRGGLAFEAHRLLYHSTLGLRRIKQTKEGEAAAIILARALPDETKVESETSRSKRKPPCLEAKEEYTSSSHAVRSDPKEVLGRYRGHTVG